MAFLAGGIRSYFTESTKGRVSRDTDDPLNTGDLASNIRRRLRRLDLERGLDLLKSSSPLLILGTGGWLLLRRRYGAGFLTFGLFILAQALKAGRPADTEAHGRQKARDRELERYALKLERGDYGHVEVIPFR